MNLAKRDPQFSRYDEFFIKFWRVDRNTAVVCVFRDGEKLHVMEASEWRFAHKFVGGLTQSGLA